MHCGTHNIEVVGSQEMFLVQAHSTVVVIFFIVYKKNIVQKQPKRRMSIWREGKHSKGRCSRYAIKYIYLQSVWPGKGL